MVTIVNVIRLTCLLLSNFLWCGRGGEFWPSCIYQPERVFKTFIISTPKLPADSCKRGCFDRDFCMKSNLDARSRAHLHRWPVRVISNLPGNQEASRRKNWPFIFHIDSSTPVPVWLTWAPPLKVVPLSSVSWVARKSYFMLQQTCIDWRYEYS